MADVPARAAAGHHVAGFAALAAAGVLAGAGAWRCASGRGAADATLFSTISATLVPRSAGNVVELAPAGARSSARLWLQRLGPYRAGSGHATRRLVGPDGLRRDPCAPSFWSVHAAAACSKPSAPTLAPEKVSVTRVDTRGSRSISRWARRIPTRSTSRRAACPRSRRRQDARHRNGHATEGDHAARWQDDALDVPLALTWSDIGVLAQLALSTGAVPYTVDGTLEMGGDPPARRRAVPLRRDHHARADRRRADELRAHTPVIDKPRYGVAGALRVELGRPSRDERSVAINREAGI